MDFSLPHQVLSQKSIKLTKQTTPRTELRCMSFPYFLHILLLPTKHYQCQLLRYHYCHHHRSSYLLVCPKARSNNHLYRSFMSTAWSHLCINGLITDDDAKSGNDTAVQLLVLRADFDAMARSGIAHSSRFYRTLGNCRIPKEMRWAR